MRKIFQTILAISTLVIASSASAQQTEKRIALVIGNAAYQSQALPTAANDAGLIAQTLQAAGFDVVGARDLDQEMLRRTFRDFIDKATASGPNTVALVYLNGYGLQLEGENYFVPVDAKIARDTDVAVEAIRISDYTRPLAALNLKANIVVLDAARAHPFAKSGQPLASGLALVEPEKGMLVAFNAAPGTVAPQEKGPYGAYAQALAEMMRTGGLSLGDVFERVRLRVNEMTKGGEVPWHASNVDAPFVFLERAPDAPPPAVSTDQVSAIRSKPIRDLDAQDAYAAALERDTLQGYLDFLAAYPDDPMARRVRAIVAARREAITWRHTRVVDTPQAYWSYLRRYPHGPHAADAHRRLAYLAAAFEPPESFAAITYDVPPPPEEEFVYFRQPVLVFDDPDYDFVPPPPPPIFFLPPPPPDFIVLEPPLPAFGLFVLPVPVYVPVPVYYNPPLYVAPPPPNVIYYNIHNTVVINNTTNMVTITNPSGQTQTVTPAQALAPQTASSVNQPTPAVTPGTIPGGQTTRSRTPTLSPGAATAVGAAAGAALLAPSLPPSVAKKATSIETQNPQVNPTAKSPAGTLTPGATSSSPARQPGRTQPGQLGTTNQPTGRPAAQSLPGSNGQPLPQINGRPAVPTQTPRPAVRTAPPPPPAARTVQPPPPAVRTAPPPPPTVRRAPPPPPTVRRAPPPPPAARTVQPPPAVRTTPPSPPTARRAAPPPPPAARTVQPPPAVRTAPPPPPAARTVQPPPPAVRTAPPPPPAARTVQPPPPAVRAAPPPPPAARTAPPPAKKPCVLPNGQPCR